MTIYHKAALTAARGFPVNVAAEEDEEDEKVETMREREGQRGDKKKTRREKSEARVAGYQ